MTPLTNLLVESEEKINVFLKKWTGSNYPHLVDTDDNDGEFLRCDMDELIRKAYLLGQSEEKERILSCGHAHELVHGFQAYGLMAESKERAIFEDGFRDGRAMLMIDVLSKRDPRKTKEALDSAIGETKE